MGHRLTSRIVVPTGDGGTTRVSVSDAICREVEATGLRPALCAHAGRVTRDTVEHWLRDGARVADGQQRGRITLNEHEQAVVRFWYDAAAAKARWISEQLRVHGSIAAGGLTTAEVVETVDPNRRDERGQPVVLSRRVRSTRTLPDARAIEWALERQARDEGFAPRTELTGADGGPVEIETRQEREQRLVEALRDFRAGAEAQKQVDEERAGRNGSEA